MKSGRTIAVVVVLALVALELVWRSSRPVHSASNESDPPGALHVSRESSAVVALATDAPGERTTVAAEPISASPATPAGVIVRVIEKDSRAPVPGATVRWIEWSSPGDWPPEAAGARAVRDRLFAKSSRAFETDERGEVRVPLAANGAQIDAEKGEFAGEMRIEEQSEVVLELVRSPVLDGFVLLDPSVEFTDLTILCLDGNGGNTPTAMPVATREPQRGRFVFRSASRGSFELTFLTRSGALLARIENVEPRLGSRDPRIDPVDLRGMLHVFHVRVLDELEQPIEFGDVSSRPTSTSIDWRTTRIDHGVARVVDTAASIDLVACAPRCRPERVAGVGGATTIHVRRGYAIRLSLASAAMLPRSPYRLHATLEPNTHEGAAEGGVRWLGELLEFGVDGTLAATVDQPGHYGINWSVALPTEGAEHPRSPILQRQQSGIVVKDEAGEQAFELSLDSRLVEAAIAELEWAKH